MELTQGRPEHRTTGRSTSGSHQPFWASGCRTGAPPTRYSNAECYHLGGVGSSEGRRRGVSRVFASAASDSPVAELDPRSQGFARPIGWDLVRLHGHQHHRPAPSRALSNLGPFDPL